MNMRAHVGPLLPDGCCRPEDEQWLRQQRAMKRLWEPRSSVKQLLRDNVPYGLNELVRPTRLLHEMRARKLIWQLLS